MMGGGEGQQQHLIRSDKNKTGYKGVSALDGRYMATCNTPPCHKNNLGTFDTPEDAAQSYLQHWEEKHPEELKQERAPRPVLPEVQFHLLIRSDKTKTGYKGVLANHGRYTAKCTTTSCKNHLGTFDTPEDAAQAYLQHCQMKHPKELKQERAPPPVLPEVQEHLLIRSDKSKTGYKGVGAHKGRYKAQCQTPPCSLNHLGTFDTPEDAAPSIHGSHR
jgi:acyl-CoA synthetase (NDP forming)